MYEKTGFAGLFFLVFFRQLFVYRNIANLNDQLKDIDSIYRFDIPHQE
jgi:hypothetical protein